MGVGALRGSRLNQNHGQAVLKLRWHASKAPPLTRLAAEEDHAVVTTAVQGPQHLPTAKVLHAPQCFCIAKTTHSQPIGLAKLHVVVRPHALVSTSGMNEALALQNKTEAMAFQTIRGGLSQRGI